MPNGGGRRSKVSQKSVTYYLNGPLNLRNAIFKILSVKIRLRSTKISECDDCCDYVFKRKYKKLQNFEKFKKLKKYNMFCRKFFLSVVHWFFFVLHFISFCLTYNFEDNITILHCMILWHMTIDYSLLGCSTIGIKFHLLSLLHSQVYN